MKSGVERGEIGQRGVDDWMDWIESKFKEQQDGMRWNLLSSFPTLIRFLGSRWDDGR